MQFMYNRQVFSKATLASREGGRDANPPLVRPYNLHIYIYIYICDLQAMRSTNNLIRQHDNLCV